MSQETPMIKQYQAIKSECPDAILFFRLGDFYEMFYDDAYIGAKELQLTLTGRGKDQSRIPMCGVPYHAANNYIQKLVTKGYKVAICEQTEDPALAKGLTKREIIKIITPGTIVDDPLLTNSEANYLMSVTVEGDNFGIAFADAAAGNIRATQVYGKDCFFYELNKIAPKEVVANQPLEINLPFTLLLNKKEPLTNLKLNYLEQLDFPLAIAAAEQLLYYLKNNQKVSEVQFSTLDIYNPNSYLYLDCFTVKNLELLTANHKSHSLLDLLDKTSTAMGRRLLKEWLQFPLTDIDAIRQRYQAVAQLFQDPLSRQELKTFLQDIYDIERIVTRIKLKTANAKDLVSLKESLFYLEKIYPIIEKFDGQLLPLLLDKQDIVARQKVFELIDSTLVENPPFILSEGNLIKSGVDQQVDELRQLAAGGQDWLTKFEAQEKEKTGIKFLKVGYNRVFGYYIEISKANIAAAPAHYIRKQTLTNGERYITEELKQKEDTILNAQTRLYQREHQLFEQLRNDIFEFVDVLKKTASQIAVLDVLNAFAQISAENNFVQPQIVENANLLEIKQGRHPVIEAGCDIFVPNDLVMNDQQNFILLFGPNMSGKSTYMRQAAILLIMAQIGCFVPAAQMSFSIVDRIFTRVGASDDLASGQSTFMMEMSETAMILKNATKNSFIILDEIGRGTSTYDGIAIAYSVSEYLVQKIKAKTIFATHYHELCVFAQNFPTAKNFRVEVCENNNQITFLHKVSPGATDRSYGIHVAKLAGLPETTIQRAEQILGSFEDKISKNFQQLSLLDSI